MGKVKETGQITLHNGEEKYQSPMGKVKNNILPCGFIIYTIYRFVKRNFELFV